MSAPTPAFQSDNVTIYHGDAREIIPKLPKVDLVITDPPYAIGAGRGEWAATAGVAIGLHEAAKRVHRKGSMLVFTTTSGRGIEFTQGAIAGKLPFNRLLIWGATGGRSRAVSPWRWDSVAIMLFGKAPSGTADESSIRFTDARHGEDTDHPSELPDGVAEWLTRPFEGDALTILDPFMGTGRLLEPAVRRGWRVVGVDVSAHYCGLAAQRLSALSRSPRGGTPSER